MRTRRLHKLVSGLAVAGLLFTAACGGDDDDGGTEASEATDNAGGIKGVVTFGNLTRNHVQTPVQYPQTPPVGGDHFPIWINCGYYDKQLPNELAVHSMEHGAVWITYLPDLEQAQVDKLKSLAENGTYLLVSPYPGLPSKVVATAWGVQLKLDSVDDPRLNQFLDKYRQGPQTPEPNAPCTGGVSP